MRVITLGKRENVHNYLFDLNKAQDYSDYEIMCSMTEPLGMRKVTPDVELPRVKNDLNMGSFGKRIKLETKANFVGDESASLVGVQMSYPTLKNLPDGDNYFVSLGMIQRFPRKPSNNSIEEQAGVKSRFVFQQVVNGATVFNREIAQRNLFLEAQARLGGEKQLNEFVSEIQKIDVGKHPCDICGKTRGNRQRMNVYMQNQNRAILTVCGKCSVDVDKQVVDSSLVGDLQKFHNFLNYFHKYDKSNKEILDIAQSHGSKSVVEQLLEELDKLNDKDIITYTQLYNICREIGARTNNSKFANTVFNKLEQKEDIGTASFAKSFISRNNDYIKQQLDSGLYDEGWLIDMFKQEVANNESKLKELDELQKQDRLVAVTDTTDENFPSSSFAPLNVDDVKESLEEAFLE